MMSDEVAGEKGSANKITGMKAWYDDVIKNGLEISATGKIRIKGRVRANAAPRTQDAAVEAKYTTMTAKEVQEILAVAGLGIVVLSDEMKTKLNNRLAELKTKK